uniref:Uncharacterized protein n=1 Tax=Oryza brachyantha TaxID=4533 RepID=J3MH65_ORYBR
REALAVGAVVVGHVVHAHPVERHPAPPVHPLAHPPTTCLAAAGAPRHPGAAVPDAGVGDVVPAVRGDERRAGPVRLDAAALRRPLLGVPDAGEHVHRLPRRERHAVRLVVPEHPDRRPIGNLHDVVWVPEDGVGVEVGGGVEPEHELLLALALAVAEDVGVQQVRLAAGVAQELEVHLVVPRAAAADLRP